MSSIGGLILKISHFETNESLLFCEISRHRAKAVNGAIPLTSENKHAHGTLSGSKPGRLSLSHYLTTDYLSPIAHHRRRIRVDLYISSRPRQINTGRQQPTPEINPEMGRGVCVDIRSGSLLVRELAILFLQENGWVKTRDVRALVVMGTVCF